MDPTPTALGVVLIAALVLQLARPGPSLQPAVATPQQRPLAPVSIAPSPAVGQVLARPLFSPTRSGTDAAGGSEAAASLADYMFVGTTFNGRAGAAIVRASSGALRSLHVGENLLGWTVAAIHPSDLVLERQAERVTVTVNSPLAAKAAAR